jgi:hypothetical protein
MAVDRCGPARRLGAASSKNYAWPVSRVDAFWADYEPHYYACYSGYRILLDDSPYGFVETSIWERFYGASLRRLCRELSCREQTRVEVKYGETILVIEFFADLWAYMKVRKKFWLAPLILVMVLLGVLIVVAQGSAIAPFIYTLF